MYKGKRDKKKTIGTLNVSKSDIHNCLCNKTGQPQQSTAQNTVPATQNKQPHSSRSPRQYTHQDNKYFYDILFHHHYNEQFIVPNIF